VEAVIKWSAFSCTNDTDTNDTDAKSCHYRVAVALAVSQGRNAQTVDRAKLFLQ
jgi:hypothetical protein